MDAAAIREAAITAHHRAAAESSVSGALAEALRREGRPALAAAQPDQAPRRLPESGVLQEAEHAAVDGAHAAGDLLRRGSPAARRAAARLQDRSRGAAPRSRCRSRCRRRARLAGAARAALPGNAHAGSGSGARALLAHDIGVLVAPPGIGKTVIGTYLVAPRVPAARWSWCTDDRCSTSGVAQLAVFLGIDAKEIGQIGAGKRNPTGRIDVAMIQSLVRKESVADLVAGYGQVIVDECHHLPAVSFERVLASAKARYVVGLTATPQRRDGHHPITQMQLGPVRFAVNAKTQASQRPFEHRLIVRETAFRPSTAAADGGIQGLYAALAQRRDAQRDDPQRRHRRPRRGALADPPDRAQGPPRVLREQAPTVCAASGRAAGRDGRQGAPRRA